MEFFRFECRPGCTRCCEVEGQVRLTGGDRLRLAAFLGLEEEAMREQFLDGMFLRSTHGRCPFLTETGCAVHPAKPTQCRLFPFWPEIVDTRQAWHRTVALCPGIGNGPLIKIEAAVETAQEMRRAFPDSYAGSTAAPA